MVTPERPGPRNRRYNRRKQRRKQVARALWLGLTSQAALTVLVLLALRFTGASFTHFGGYTLLLIASAALLLPAWSGGLVAGFLSPSIRWWQLFTLGAAATALFLALTAFLTDGGGLPLALRIYLAPQLTLAPVITGWLGHWCRIRAETPEPWLEPRPWES